VRLDWQDVQGFDKTKQQRRRMTAVVDQLDGGCYQYQVELREELPATSWPLLMQQRMPQKRQADDSAATNDAKRRRTSHHVS